MTIDQNKLKRIYPALCWHLFLKILGSKNKLINDK